MSFTATTYRVLIASPSDLAEERKAATDAHDFVPADPLFSFDLLWNSGWEERLADAKAVAAELHAFSQEFETLRASQALQVYSKDS